MILWMNAGTALFTLAVISTPAVEPNSCRVATAAFHDAENAVTDAVRTYEKCVSSSHGQNSCTAEMDALDDAHEDFEDSVNDYKKACR